MKKLIIIAISLIFIASCKDKDGLKPIGQSPQTNPSAVNSSVPVKYQSGVVKKVENAAGYTYVQVKVGDKLVWAASNKRPIKVGQKLAFPDNQPMVNFKSKTLKRTFPIVYFATHFLVGDEVKNIK